MAKPAKVHQAPDSATSPKVKVKRDPIADHELIDSTATVVEDEEAATGIRYTLLANSKAFDYQYGKSGDADRMLACFGAKTLATNVTSGARQNGASPDEQIAAVAERFALLTTGVWVDRTREGAKIDLDALAQAIVNVLVAEGKLEADKADAYRLERRAKMDADASFAPKARSYPPVAAAYNSIVGRATASVDDLMN